MHEGGRMTGFSRHRKSGACVATFTAFEADLLRSLAGQLIELLRNETAAPESADPLEAMLDFSGPTLEPEDPVLARLFPTAYPADDEAAAEFRRYTETELRNGKASGAASIIDALEDAGLTPQPEDGMFIDVELSRDLDAFVHRHAARDRHPSRDRGGRRGVLARARRGRPACPGPRHLRVGRVPAGDAGPGCELTRYVESECRAARGRRRRTA
jgi:hypothetical protein